MTSVCWAAYFPKLYDLYSASDRHDPDNYFKQRKVEQALRNRSSGLVEIENNMQEMDETAWTEFKSKTAGYVTKKDRWGWPTQLFDRFNEVKGYLYLKTHGYADIHFAAEGAGGKTPDLSGRRREDAALLEVKTIHESDDANNYLTNEGEYKNQKDFQKVQHFLNTAMREKLKNTLEYATEQLFQFPFTGVGRRIIFLVIRLDPNSATQSAKSEIERFLRDNCPDDVELVHCIENEFLLD